MSVKDTAKRVYIRIIDGASEQYNGHSPPREGWLMTMRKALGMSGPQLARRVGVTKAAIYQAERKELAGEVTIKQMEKMAKALGGKFVYAVIPDIPSVNAPQGSQPTLVADLVRAQALLKAEGFVRRASTHMALEKQALSEDKNKSEIERLTDQLVRDMPSNFWDTP